MKNELGRSLISGLVITYNEEARIVDCIRSLRQVCDDVVVVDSCSTDKTRELATAAGALVVEQAFLGDGPQRSLGVPLCQHDWILNLDADEVLEPDFVDYLNSTDIAALGVAALENPRRNFIANHSTKRAGQYPDYVVRVFDRRLAGFSNVKVHTRIQTDSRLRVKGHIRHFSYKDYTDLFARAVKYADWAASDLVRQGRRVGMFSAFTHGLTSFLKHYVIKLGFLAGAGGLNIALAKALSSYLKYARAREIQLLERKPD